jgi:hypothetical protein
VGDERTAAPAHPTAVRRSSSGPWFEPALLLLLVVLGGLAYGWYTGAVARTLGSQGHQAVAAPTSR